MNPILEDRGMGTNRVAVALANQMAPINSAANKESAYTSLLSKFNIPDSAEARALYEKVIVPQMFDKTAQEALADTAKAKSAGLTSALEGDKTKITADNQVATALAGSQFDRSLAEQQANSTLPAEKNKTRMLQGEPVWKEAGSVSQRLMNLGQGQTVFDPMAGPQGKAIYQSPLDPMKQIGLNAMNKAQGIPVSNPSAQAQQPVMDYTVDDLIIDPSTKRILGVKRK